MRAPPAAEAPLDDPFDLSSLVGEYRDEARDQLERLDAALLALEDHGAIPPDDATPLLRDLHTLKGNSGMLGFRPIVDAVHVIEGVFKESEQALPRDRLDLLFEAAAALRQAVEQAGTDSETDAFTRLGSLELASRLESFVGTSYGHTPIGAQAPDPSGSSEAPAPAADTAAVTAAPADTREKKPPRRKARARQREVPEAEGPDTASESLRVPFAKLDELLDQVGELTSVGASLDALLERYDDTLDRAGADLLFAEIGERLDRITRALRTATMEIRMVPVQRVFSRFPTLARDLAREQGKQVRVELEGGEVELDKSMVDAMGDPLLHLVRNAVDHGIRTTTEREAAGKEPTGTIFLRAVRQGDRVRVEVSDDGQGLDVDALRHRARVLGVVGEHESVTPEQAAELIFRPGFSSRASSDTVSGRGIGLDAVKQRVTALRGTVSVETPEGGGTRFVLSMPLTLAILPAIVFQVEGVTFALPTVSVERTVRGAAPEMAGTAEVLRYAGELLPVMRAARAFGWGDGSRPSGAPAPFAVVIHSGARRAAVLADRLLDQRDLVVKAVPRYLGRLPAVSGASVATDGGVILLLDPAGLLDLNLALHQRENRAFTAPQDPDRRG